MKILFLTKYSSEGPSSRYRSYNYKIFFEKEGIKCEYSPLFYNGYVKSLYKKEKISKLKILICYLKRIIYILKNKSKYDHIIIEKELLPYVPYFIENLLLFKSNYSLDFDDNPKDKYKKGIFSILFKNKIENLCRKAKFITVGNHWYFEEFKNNKNFYYLPTVIDLDKYTIKSYSNNDKRIKIIWIGSPSNLKNLFLVENVLKNLAKKYLLKLVIIGGKVNIEGIECEEVKWQEETEIEELTKGDIGIMPLNNGYWEKGKCGFKLIQYMGVSLPVVASRVSANVEIIDEGINGYLCETENEWYKVLEKLILDSELRKKLGKNGRKIIEEKFNYKVNTLKYLDILRGLK